MKSFAYALSGAAASAIALASTSPASAQDAELAQKLSNPVASLISVPSQVNYDSGYGPADGYRVTLNVQPVIPISLSKDWNLISRTIVPSIGQRDIAGRSGGQSGLGDITQSLFFSPRAVKQGGVIWGIGPVLTAPSATNDLLGAGKWGAGPAAVVLKQSGPLTYGMLANHIWSFAGDRDRNAVSSTFLQPFLTYTTRDAWTLGINSESAYNWKRGEWAVPVHFTVSKLVKFGNQPVSFGIATRYWMVSPRNGPEGVGLRGIVTFLFPKK